MHSHRLLHARCVSGIRRCLSSGGADSRFRQVGDRISRRRDAACQSDRRNGEPARTRRTVHERQQRARHWASRPCFTAPVVLVLRRWGHPVQRACRNPRGNRSGTVFRTDRHARSRTRKVAWRRAARGEHRRPCQPRADATAHRRTERRLQSGAASDHAGKQRLDRSGAGEFHPGLQRVVGTQWTCRQCEPRAEQRHIQTPRSNPEAAINSRRAVRSSSICARTGMSSPMRPSVRA